MAGDVPRVKHLVLEMRYDPTLAVYGVMDKIGIAMASSYPDWERSPLSLELRDKKNRRRAMFTNQRCFYETVGFSMDVDSEFDRASKLFDKLHHELNFPLVRRIGIRQWVAVAVTDKFELVVKNLARKLLPQQEALSNALRGSVDDLSYVVTVRSAFGWRYLLRAGPMERKQWFETFLYEQGMFQSPDAFQEFKESIPETMILIDVDAFQEDVPYSDLSSVVASIRRGSEEIIGDLTTYLMG